jgi:hypothetical protein
VLDSVELVQVSEEAFAESAMANEISAGSRKRRRQLSISEPVADPTPVLDVVLPRRRRSSRSNKYQGFKPKVVGDNPKRKSHVKPMCAPAKKQPVSAKLKGKEVSDEADSSQAEDPTMNLHRSNSCSMLAVSFVAFLLKRYRNISFCSLGKMVMLRWSREGSQDAEEFVQLK